MEFLVALFDKDLEHPFDLAGATAIETEQGERHAAACFATLHLAKDTPAVVGVVPKGATYPCVVVTYEVVVHSPLRPPSLAS